MALTYTTAVKNAKLDQITSQIGASGRLKIYDATGGTPANAGTALGSQVLLADLPCSATFAPASSGGVLTANAITNANAAATGTAAFFRLTTSGGTAVAQGACGTSGSDLNLNTLSLVSGGPVAVSSLTITSGN
jgi:hypothetical protein